MYRVVTTLLYIMGKSFTSAFINHRHFTISWVAVERLPSSAIGGGSSSGSLSLDSARYAVYRAHTLEYHSLGKFRHGKIFIQRLLCEILTCEVYPWRKYYTRTCTYETLSIYLRPPVTVHDITPPRLKNSEQTLDSFRGKRQMTTPLIFTATA